MTVKSDYEAAAAQLREGRVNAALKTAKVAMKRHQAHPAFPNFAGIALCSQNRHRAAIPYFQKALKLSPDFHDARKNLSQALIFLGEFDTAKRLLEKLVQTTRTDQNAWYMLAMACFEGGHTKQALAAVNTAIDLNPEAAQPYNLRGLILSSQGRIVDALDSFQAAVTRAPNDVEILLNASEPLAEHMLHQEALSLLHRAVAIAPDRHKPLFWLASQQLALGELDAARDGFKAVLEIQPNNTGALERLSSIQTGEENANMLPQLREAAKTHAPKSAEAAQLNIAFGRIADQQGRLDKAAAAWIAANRSLAKLHPYDANADTALNDRILSRFDGQEIRNDTMPEGPRPVYVLGLPRSGTSLTEAVLSAHSQVAGCGERNATASLIYPLIENDLPFDAAAMADFVRQDHALLPDLPPNTVAYVDKMPENYRLIGFILAAYPEARIIHVQRDPRDIALSMWKAMFGGKALSYTYDLKAMAHRFNLYATTMKHWHKVFPNRVFDLRYEGLVQDVQASSQSLANLCGLEWEPAMARPDLNTEQVLTMSASQIRQPVHSRSVGGWRQYEAMLAPFVDALDPDLWPDLGSDK